jgi:hypothetical protein
MSKRRIFSVETPLGYHVGLSRDRWRQIVRFKHPALAGGEKAVRECLLAPSLVRASAKDREVHLYYRKVKGVFLCVVAAPDRRGERFVVTAYFTRNIKEGAELWRK